MKKKEGDENYKNVGCLDEASADDEAKPHTFKPRRPSSVFVTQTGKHYAPPQNRESDGR